MIGLCVLQSFDNEPYVGYVRDDRHFKSHFIGQTFESLSNNHQLSPSTEGVSGATMTSQAIAEAIITAAHSAHKTQSTSSFVQQLSSRLRAIDGPQWGALLVILCGLVIGFTRLRGHWGRTNRLSSCGIFLPRIWCWCFAVPSTNLGLGNSWHSSGRPGTASPFYHCHRDTCHNRS